MSSDKVELDFKFSTASLGSVGSYVDVQNFEKYEVGNSNIKLQGISIYGKMETFESPKYDGKVSTASKVLTFGQTGGQLTGALGLLASGLMEGNLWRVATGAMNTARSTGKMVFDSQAKDKNQSHKNDEKEGYIAAFSNGISVFGARSFEERLASIMGASAWVIKGRIAHHHAKREQQKEIDVEKQKQAQDFFAANPVRAPEDEAVKPSKVMGYLYKQVENLKHFGRETSIFALSAGPPLMMMTRAVSYVTDGVNNNDASMLAGGVGFVVGAGLMIFKDGKNYIEAYMDRKEKRDQEKSAKKLFEQAVELVPIVGFAEFNANDTIAVSWSSEEQKLEEMEKFVINPDSEFNGFNRFTPNGTTVSS